MHEAAQMIVDGITFTEELVGATVTWAGSTYPCAGGPESRGKSLTAGGFSFSDCDCVIVLRLSLLANRPAEKQIISYRSAPDATARNWRIETIRTLWDAIMVLECSDPNRAA